MTPCIPQLPPQPASSDFLRGVLLPFKAFGLILRTPKLLALSLLCAVVTFAAIIALTVLLWSGSYNLLAWVWAPPDSWWAAAAWWLVRLLTFLLLWAVALTSVPGLLLAPLQDPLSEAAEEACGDFKAPSFKLGAFARGLGLGLLYTLTRTLLLLLGLAILFPLNLIPGLGSVLWTALGSLWSMVWLAAEHLGGPMARHFYPFAQVRRILRARLALCLGFGLSVYLLLWVPVLNTFFLPVAIVGGTLLFRGLRACGALGPPPLRA